jgi:hypothetical protein
MKLAPIDPSWVLCEAHPDVHPEQADCRWPCYYHVGAPPAPVFSEAG